MRRACLSGVPFRTDGIQEPGRLFLSSTTDDALPIVWSASENWHPLGLSRLDRSRLLLSTWSSGDGFQVRSPLVLGLELRHFRPDGPPALVAFQECGARLSGSLIDAGAGWVGCLRATTAHRLCEKRWRPR